jgi:protein-tyrosine-phosphatase
MIRLALISAITIASIAISACGNSSDSAKENSSSDSLSVDTLNWGFSTKMQLFVDSISQHLEGIDSSRKQELNILADYIQESLQKDTTVQLTYICTHNSRRSHMAQLWAAVAAHYYGVKGVKTYSGGTETTAFNQRSVACLQRQGFEITPLNEDKNTLYAVVFSDKVPAVKSFSKVYNDSNNPQNGFIAVMTCSHADEACPVVNGASKRVAIPYIDPKISDGTTLESQTYYDRSAQIATEAFYVFKRVKGSI